VRERERERKTNKKYYVLCARPPAATSLSLSVAKKRMKKKKRERERERERREKTTRARARSKPYFFFFTQSVRARVLFDLSFHQTNTLENRQKKEQKHVISNNKKEKEITWCDDRLLADCLSLSLFSRLSLFCFFRFGGKRENKTDAGEESMCEFFYARLSVHVFPIHRVIS